MQTLRLPIVALGIILILACGTAAPPEPSPKHIRQSTRHLDRGATLFKKGCYFRALDHYQQAHERYTAADQIEGIAHSLNGIANVYYRLGDGPRAVSAYNEAIETYGLANAQSGVVRAICNKSAALISANRLTAAETSMNQADQAAGFNRIMPALRHKVRALLKMKTGSVRDAETLLKKAIRAAENSEPDQLASANYTMGQLLLDQQRPSEAINFIEKSLSLDRAAGAYDDVAHDLSAMGRCHFQLMQQAKAATHVKRSIKIFALLGNATKVKTLANLLKSQAIGPNQEIEATLRWANQWLAGDKEANLCR